MSDLPAVVGDLTEPTEMCPWCREEKPFSLWYGVINGPGGWNPREGPVVCAECRERGAPDVDPYLEDLPVPHRKILRALMGGANFYEAARIAGVSPSYPGNLLRDRNHGGGKAIRAAFQTLLEMEGLDIFSIARQMSLLFNAKKPMWNPKEERWDWFPDNSVQLGAMRHLTKISELDPPRDQQQTQGPAVAVRIETNLGGKSPGDPPGTYTIEVGEERAQMENPNAP